MESELFSGLQTAAQSLWSVIFVTDSGHRLYWFYLLTFSAIASIVYLLRKPINTSLLQFIFPVRLFTTRSSKTDFIIYIVNSIVLATVNLATVLISTGAVAHTIASVLAMTNDGSGLGKVAGSATQWAFSIAFLLLTDFAIFFAHYLHHKVPMLWSFHKTHHSAKVLTPVTAFRFHPVEITINGVILALLLGPLIGVYQFVFDSNFFEGNPTIFGVAMLLWLLTANFRHSHIPLHYPAIISNWLVSPAMHNLHHSTKPKHFDKNFGLLFSIWDRIAGTYFLPEKGEELQFGLSGKEPFDTATECYVTPFRQFIHQLQSTLKRFSFRKS